jgi:hypothetical protein
MNKQHVLVFLIAEILGHGERRKANPHTGSWRFVHLAEAKGGVFEDARGLHFAIKVIAFARAFPHPGEDGNAMVLGSDVGDQFLNQNGFADSGAAEESRFCRLSHKGKANR